MIYIGIDPGLDGVVAALGIPHLEGRPYVWSIETIKTKKRRKINRQRFGQILDWLASYGNAGGGILCHIEEAMIMPKQGAVSGLTIGKNYGLIVGMLEILDIPYEEVHPRTWKKKMLADTDKSKGAAIIKAKALFPGIDLKRTDKCKKDDHNKAEALLLAEHARRTHGGA